MGEIGLWLDRRWKWAGSVRGKIKPARLTYLRLHVKGASFLPPLSPPTLVPPPIIHAGGNMVGYDRLLSPRVTKGSREFVSSRSVLLVGVYEEVGVAEVTLLESIGIIFSPLVRRAYSMFCYAATYTVLRKGNIAYR
jgi:hypothetical protein